MKHSILSGFGSVLLALVAMFAAPREAAAQTMVHATGPATTTAAQDATDRRYWRNATANLRAAAAVALGGAGAPPLTAAPPLRKSITSLTATELASLRKGIAQMIAWNTAPRGSANFKRSLIYWANMHSFVGPNQTPPIVCSRRSGLTNPGMSGLSIQAPTTPDEQTTWCTCQHGTIQFLTWHRMYLYYFEKVLQAAAGDANLRLPFWDYETNGRIPDAYRLPTYLVGTVATPNPLYVANRQAQLANGTGALDPLVTSPANAMAQTTYATFNPALEGTPHGAVHCATGVAGCPSGYMGFVPTAGNDPIFYTHHANIDRLYECWLRVNQAARLPSDPAQLARTFSFIDGSGTLVTRRVGDMLTTGQLGYGYARGGGCPPLLKGGFSTLRDRAVQIIPLSGPVILQRGMTNVPLRIVPETRKAMLAATAAPAKDGAAARATLVIDGLTFDEAPTVLYKVSIKGANGRVTPVGVINFFNATAPHEDMGGDMAGMDHANMGAEMGKPAETSFDATAALAASGASGDATLVFEPFTGVTGSTAALATARISPKANVRFTSARIELR